MSKGSDIHNGWKKGARIERRYRVFTLLDNGVYKSTPLFGTWFFRAIDPDGLTTTIFPCVEDRVLKEWEGPTKPHSKYSRACCDQAVPGPFCVCVENFMCPVHGDMHIGTHD